MLVITTPFEALFQQHIANHNQYCQNYQYTFLLFYCIRVLEVQTPLLVLLVLPMLPTLLSPLQAMKFAALASCVACWPLHKFPCWSLDECRSLLKSTETSRPLHGVGRCRALYRTSWPLHAVCRCRSLHGKFAKEASASNHSWITTHTYVSWYITMHHNYGQLSWSMIMWRDELSHVIVHHHA